MTTETLTKAVYTFVNQEGKQVVLVAVMPFESAENIATVVEAARKF